MHAVTRHSLPVLLLTTFVACSPDSNTEGTDGNGGAPTAGGSSAGGGSGSGGLGANTGGASGGGGSSSSGGQSGPDLPEFCRGLEDGPGDGQWQSSRVFYEDGSLQYTFDDEENGVVDFSYAGYRYGEQEPPEVPEKERLGPTSGDQTARIQAAIDAVAALEPDADGWRGAVVLEPGVYEISGTIRVHQSGVVLRGSGDGEDPAENTILIGKRPPNSDRVILVGSGKTSSWNSEVNDTRTDIISDVVRAGDRTLTVADASSLRVGDNVILRHPSTSAWVDSKDKGGVTAASPSEWQPGELDMVFNRRIVAIEGNELTLDVPIYDHLIRSVSQSYLYKTARTDLVTQVGVEDLRVDIENLGGTSEDHRRNAIELVGVEDAWVRRATLLHFWQAGVRTSEALRVTIDDVRALEPVGVPDGGRFYNFNAEARSQQILIKHCHAHGGRHNFVSNGTSSVSGFVVYRSISDDALTSSEGHRRWSQAMLFDNVTEINSRNTRLIGLYNRGDWGTAHGWANVHSVLWNYDTGSGHAVVQKPPGGQNYLFGGAGGYRTDMNTPWPGPGGFVERQEGELFPGSLYEAQLCERLKAQRSSD